jgi:hypothetical protein
MKKIDIVELRVPMRGNDQETIMPQSIYPTPAISIRRRGSRGSAKLS